MFNSTVLEVAIGLVFCYASVALITSSVQEALASAMQTRSKDLLDNIRKLLNANTSSASGELLLGLYNHALVHPTGSGNYSDLKELEKRGNRPEHIDARNFAIAFIDTIDSTQNRWGQLGASIDKIENPQLQKLLHGMRERVQSDAQKLQNEVAAWFDAAMAQASEAYKRKTQLFCFLYALGIAIVLNIDSVHLFKTLWQHPALVAQATATTTPANISISETLDKLNTLPIGWSHVIWSADSISSTIYDWLARSIGWLITASAALFGAPFWFDLLQKLVNLRNGTAKLPTNGESKTQPTSPAPAAPPASNLQFSAERNAIVDVHAARNKDDPSYRPLQPGERW